MPILEIQQKMAETGRIRMGQKVPTSSGKQRPDKLDTFKLTSKHREVIDDVAQVYGGEVKPFEGNQWGVITTAKSLNVVVPPGAMSFSQWREMWGKGICHRRCDGQRETISDGDCQCPADPAERAALAQQGKACKDTTRLSVMLPDLLGVGLWRLESHGYYAAVELNGSIDIIQSLAPGTLVRARLSAEPRSVARFDKDGNPQTMNYVVPVLDLADVRLTELMAPTGDGVSVQIESKAPGLTAVPELVAGPGMSIAEQLAAPPPEQKPRSNAAAELPATGLQPRNAPPAAADQDDDEPAEAEIVDDKVPAGGWQVKNRKLQAEVHELWKGDSDTSIDERRKVLVSMASDGRTRSSKQLTDEEWDVVFSTTDSMKEGLVELHLRADGEWDLRHVPSGGGGASTQGDAAPTPGPEPTGMELPTSSDEWRELLKRQGCTQRELLEEAWRLSGSKGKPGSLAQLVGHEVAGDVLVWLHSRREAA